jgi:hypothetical protein
VDPTGLQRLQAFFEAAPAAARALRPLVDGAAVGLRLDEGPAGFEKAGGAARLTAGAPADPDFTLSLPAAAVERLTTRPDAGVGALGIAFFELLLSRDPALRVTASVQAPLPRLVRHGWLGVLALGGARVAAWLLRKGLADPRAVIERLRRSA